MSIERICITILHDGEAHDIQLDDLAFAVELAAKEIFPEAEVEECYSEAGGSRPL